MSGWTLRLGLAGRDLIRRPLEAALLAAGLFGVAVFVAGVLLVAEGARATAETVLEPAPDLVARRVSPHGFLPLPAGIADEVRARVVGPTRVAARVWGVVESHAGAVTVIAAPTQDGGAQLGRGEARVGPGLTIPVGEQVNLGTQPRRSFVVVEALPAGAALVAHDLVVLHPEDARDLLALGPGEASDLALWVFHPEEAEVLIPDLRDAMPWPVQVTTKTRQRGLALRAIANRGSLGLVALLPALLALLVLAAGAVRDRLGRREEVGLLLALGWTFGDIVRLQLLRGLVLALPATVVGLIVAYLAIHGPGADAVVHLIWSVDPPLTGAALDPSGAVAVLLQTLVGVVLPWCAIVVTAAVVAGRGDVARALQGRA